MQLLTSVEEFYRDIWTSNNKAVLDLLIHPALNEESELSDPTILARGRESFAAIVDAWHIGFDEICETPIEIVVAGHRCMAMFEFTGRHSGTFENRKATGRRVKMAGVDYLEFRGTQIVKWRCIEDIGSLLSQISGAER